MSARHVFNLRSEERRRPLPTKVLLVQRETETLMHILLKLFGYLLFYRDRVRLEPGDEDAFSPFRPDIAQFDYEGRVALWVECGECGLEKLDRLAVKAPYGEIWVVKRSATAAEELARQMEREGLRRGRYGIIGLDSGMLEEVGALSTARNDVVWYRGTLDPPLLQFEFNGLWFESEFVVIRH